MFGTGHPQGLYVWIFGVVSCGRFERTCQICFRDIHLCSGVKEDNKRKKKKLEKRWEFLTVFLAWPFGCLAAAVIIITHLPFIKMVSTFFSIPS
jgi:hypothetical protein